jgi:hypothetical protein
MDRHAKVQGFAPGEDVWIVSVIVGLGPALIILISISLRVQQGLGAFIHGEGIWSKAQKDAVISIFSYMETLHSAV